MRTRPVPVGLSLATVLVGCVSALVAAGTGTAAASQPGHGRHAQRVCTTATSAKTATCHAEVMVSDATGAVPPSAVPAASALTPAQVRNAYRLTGDSTATVAVVDAYGYPNLERDLTTYRSYFGLPACTRASGCLRIIDQWGGSKLPRFNGGWAGETALDVDAVSATCPGCKILVVQARSATFTDLGAAVNTAAAQPGVRAISNSYGAGDLPDSTYGSYYNHPGIAVTASTGDNGYTGGSFPASSAYVTAVGGTSLQPGGSSSRGWTETAWSGAGSGCSTVNAALPAASTFSTGCSRRAIADVAAAADPSQGGLAVYYPTSRTSSTWATVGGTSESSPIIAAVYALSGNTAGYANAIPYGHAAALFDITGGSNGSCPTTQWCNAGTGWDGPTGLGTPNGTSAF